MSCLDNRSKDSNGLCPLPELELNIFNTGQSYNDYIKKLQDTVLQKPCDYMKCGPIVTELANDKTIKNIINKPCDTIDCKGSINNILSNLPIIIKIFLIIIFIYLIISIIYNITG